MSDRDWFVPLSEANGRMLVGFPHAGAGCAQLAPLARLLASRDVQVWSANLKGSKTSPWPLACSLPIVTQAIQQGGEAAGLVEVHGGEPGQAFVITGASP